MKLHRSKGHVEPPSGPFSHLFISGRTLIACQNCASAKTGCDKKIPCSRCLEKNIQCIARYARRASKAAIRAAAQAASSLSTNSLLTSTVENISENILLQSPIQHLYGGTDQYDDHFRDAFHNPLSPWSSHSAAATSLGSSSYSDMNAFERRQNSPIHIGFSEFSTNMEFTNNDVSSSVPNGFRCRPENTDNCSNRLTSLPEMHCFQESKNYGSFVNIPQVGKDAASFQGNFCNPLHDIDSTLNHSYLTEIPNLNSAKIWIKRLKRNGLFDGHSPSIHVDESIQLHQQSDVDSQRPGHDRLAYNWAKLDQELSLFYDVEQTLSLSDFTRPLPDPNVPWHTRSIIQTSYSYLIDGLHSEINIVELPGFELRQTLKQLFQDITHGTLPDRVPPRHLQLLLHPLQALTYHSRSLLSWARNTSSLALSGIAASSVLETERLLRSWYTLATKDHNEDTFTTDIILGLILYHFIFLNLAVNLVEIERLTNPGSLDLAFWQRLLQDQGCFRSRQEAIFHCGQALRHLRAVDVDTRPWWWPTAVHRAILTLWAASHLVSINPDPNILEASSVFPMEDLWQQSSTDIAPGTNMSTSELCIIAIDGATPEDPCFRDANWSEKYILVLTRLDEGVVALTDTTGILEYGISLIGALPSSLEGETVIAMLKSLEQAWEGK
ncbi:hypothetical protein GGI43DRAFT_429394 [Trichoderma evansii]